MNSQWGYIDKKGTMVIETRFDDAVEFSESFARIKLNGNWGFINATGGIVVDPQFEEAGDFKEGLARVKVNGKWGMLVAFVRGKHDHLLFAQPNRPVCGLDRETCSFQ